MANEGNYILFVDDDEKFLELVSSLLRAKGFLVLTATTVSTAINLLQVTTVKLLIVDWHLGPQAGAEPTSASIIREARSQTPNIPVIVISGLKDLDVWTDAASCGADSFFPKPLRVEILAEHLERWMKRQLADELLGGKELLSLETLKRRYVKKAVAQLNGNVSLAAQKLGIHRHTVAAILEEPQESEEDSR